jgi:hypothetical protein
MMYGQSIDDGETTQGHIPRLLGLYMFLLATTLYEVFLHLFLMLYGLDMCCFSLTLLEFSMVTLASDKLVILWTQDNFELNCSTHCHCHIMSLLSCEMPQSLQALVD